MEKEDRLRELQERMLTGHCAESRTAIHNSGGNIDKIMATFWYYIRECTRKDFPTLPMLRTLFAGGITEPYGGYIDKQGEVVACRRMVFYGASRCQCTTTAYNIYQCWLRHESELVVRMADHSHLHIDCFEHSQLVLHVESSTCKAVVKLYGNAKLTTSGHTECITVRHMGQETYEEKN